MSGDYSKYQYQPIVVRFSWWVRFQNYWMGRRERKNVLKRFCLESGIDYPLIVGKKYNFPEKFFVQTDWISYLGKLRDEMLLELFGKYHEMDSRLTEEVNRVSGEIERQEEVLMQQKAELTELKKALGKGLSNVQYIDIEGRVNTREAKVKNQTDEIQTLKIERRNLEDIQAANGGAWLKQLANINALLEETSKKHAYHAAKKLRNKLNYTNLDFVRPEYSDETMKVTGVQNLVREEKQERKTVVKSTAARLAAKKTSAKKSGTKKVVTKKGTK